MSPGYVGVGNVDSGITNKNSEAMAVDPGPVRQQNTVLLSKGHRPRMEPNGYRRNARTAILSSPLGSQSNGCRKKHAAHTTISKTTNIFANAGSTSAATEQRLHDGLEKGPF